MVNVLYGHHLTATCSCVRV